MVPERRFWWKKSQDPQAAIKTGRVDLVLPLHQIATALVSIASNRSMAPPPIEWPGTAVGVLGEIRSHSFPWLGWSIRDHIYQ